MPSKPNEDPLCRKIVDRDIRTYAHALETGKSVSQSSLEIATVLRAYVALRNEARKRARPNDVRNCDVMVTPAALRKGWERRCEYGTPCCPFEYALEPFDSRKGQHD